MQRRNFRMPEKNQRRGQVGGSTQRGDQKREFDQRTKDHRSDKRAPEKSTQKDPGAKPQPDDEGRWQDDGGESGEK